MTEPNTPGGAGLPDGPSPAPATPPDAQPPDPSAVDPSWAAPTDPPAADAASAPEATPPLEGSPGYGLPIGMADDPATSPGPAMSDPAMSDPAPAASGDPSGYQPGPPAASDPAAATGDLGGYQAGAPAGDPGSYQGAIPGAGDPAGSWTPGAVGAGGMAAASTAAPPKKRGLIRVVAIVALIVIVVGAVVYFTRGQKSASDLTVGDCFEVPSASTNIDSVKSGPCTDSHTGEIFFIANYPDASAYPSDSDFEQFAEDQCNPVYTTYVGASLDSTPDLTVGFFYPQEDGWSSGDRVVKCYVTRQDGGALTKSLKGSGGN
jgi:hypothetical protein